MPCFFHKLTLIMWVPVVDGTGAGNAQNQCAPVSRTIGYCWAGIPPVRCETDMWRAGSVYWTLCVCGGALGVGGRPAAAPLVRQPLRSSFPW